jgi:Peptidase family C50
MIGYKVLIKAAYYVAMSKLKLIQFIEGQMTNYQFQLFQESVLSIPWCTPTKAAQKVTTKSSKKDKLLLQLIQFLKEAHITCSSHGQPGDVDSVARMMLLLEFLKSYIFPNCLRESLPEIIFNIGTASLIQEYPKTLFTRRQRCGVTDTLMSEGDDPVRPQLASFKCDFLALIPDNLAICTINFDVERNDLYITRCERGSELIFKLPLTRQATRQGEQDGLTFKIANDMFLDIMDQNKETTSNAKHCLTAESRKEWFALRKSLDGQLKMLLHKVESCWLGGFKVHLISRQGLFSTMDFESTATDRLLSAFKNTIETILFNSVSKPFSAKPTRLSFDIEMFKTILRMGQNPGYDEVEDLIYYLIDTYQYQGVPVVHDELDIDAV